jgi:fructokinase
MPLVVGLGEILWDILPGGIRHLGGAPMNVAVHAQALGCTASVISAVGDDALGREAIERLQRHGLEVSAVQIMFDRPTGAVDVRLKDGQPSYEFRAGVAWDFLQQTGAARAAVEAADAVVFGTLAQRNDVSRQTIHALLARTRGDCLRVFDVNLRPPFFTGEAICSSLAHANVLKLNDGELPIVLSACGVSAHGRWVEALFGQYEALRAIALTCGAAGSTVFSRHNTGGHTLAAHPVVVQDTVGAGDAFTAVLIAGMLRGHALEPVHARAVEAAAFVCSQSGATPPLPGQIADWLGSRGGAI